MVFVQKNRASIVSTLAGSFFALLIPARIWASSDAFTGILLNTGYLRSARLVMLITGIVFCLSCAVIALCLFQGRRSRLLKAGLLLFCLVMLLEPLAFLTLVCLWENRITGGTFRWFLDELCLQAYSLKYHVSYTWRFNATQLLLGFGGLVFQTVSVLSALGITFACLSPRRSRLRSICRKLWFLPSQSYALCVILACIPPHGFYEDFQAPILLSAVSFAWFFLGRWLSDRAIPRRSPRPAAEKAPPLPPAIDAELIACQALLDAGQITPADFEARKAHLLHFEAFLSRP